MSGQHNAPTGSEGFAAGLREMVRAQVREEVERMLSEQAATGEYFSPMVAARRADVRPATIRRWVREGRLVAHHAGRAVRIKRADLETFLVRNRRREHDLSPEQMAARDFG